MKTYEATGEYRIEPAKVKDKTVYHVVCPNGCVANNYDHPTYKSAKHHMNVCAEFGKAKCK